jgi:hypothetical protein
MLVTTQEFLSKGLSFVQIKNHDKWSFSRKVTEFKKEYGVHPTTIATQWYDLCQERFGLTESDKNEKGMKMFLVAHHFLFSYNKNSHQLAHKFKLTERDCRGIPLWIWIERIAGLQEIVIF